ncbi:MAG: diaminopimelate decarboxylase, partial [Thalassospira sp.]|nr:diaminopimelate decarboxylase [Thalassospira sp.]
MNAPVDVINYKNGVLYMEEMPLHPLTSKVGTPFYCYSTAALRNAYLQYSRAFADRQALICFAVKANCNPSLLRLFGQLGAGADVVSIGELRFAMKAGIPANKIVFSGVGKTKTELTEALKAGVLQINVESESELKLLDSIAQSLSLVATVAIRVNPDVDAGTHKKITTGKYNTKFGVACEDALDMFMLAGNLPGVAARGLAVHIGSQLTSLEPFEAAFTKLAELVVELRTMGQTITRLDLGGGLGVKYHNENIPAMSAYAAMVKKITDPLKVQLIFEPGRSLVASGGVLVTEVIHTKQNPER